MSNKEIKEIKSTYKYASNPDDKINAAIFGYSLAEQETASLRSEIERLEKLLHEQWNEKYPNPEFVQDLWEQFKKDHNL